MLSTVFVILRSAVGPTFTVVFAWLLVLFWSYVLLFMLTRLVIVVVLVVICVRMCSTVFVPFGRFGMVHVPVVGLYAPLESSDIQVTPVGKISCTKTLVALSGPLLCAVIV